MIYAINKRTKEHVDVTDMHMPFVANYFNRGEWHLVGADDDGWIPWDTKPGAECPLPKDGYCDVKHVNGFIGDRFLAINERWSGIGAPAGCTVIAYRPILNAESSEPEVAEWDGEGLPPVGCECDCYHTGTYQGVVTVRYMGSGMCVLLNHDRGEEQCGPIDAYSFRPIRSEEDEAVEEMAEIISKGFNVIVDDCINTARALHRAGYRRQAEGGEHERF